MAGRGESGWEMGVRRVEWVLEKYPELDWEWLLAADSDTRRGAGGAAFSSRTRLSASISHRAFSPAP